MGQDIKTGEPKVKERAGLLHRLFERAWHETSVTHDHSSSTHKSQVDLSDIQIKKNVYEVRQWF